MSPIKLLSTIFGSKGMNCSQCILTQLHGWINQIMENNFIQHVLAWEGLRGFTAFWWVSAEKLTLCYSNQKRAYTEKIIFLLILYSLQYRPDHEANIFLKGGNKACNSGDRMYRIMKIWMWWGEKCCPLWWWVEYNDFKLKRQLKHGERDSK